MSNLHTKFGSFINSINESYEEPSPELMAELFDEFKKNADMEKLKEYTTDGERHILIDWISFIEEFGRGDVSLANELLTYIYDETGIFLEISDYNDVIIDSTPEEE